MGMWIDGKWEDTADRSMVSGTYRREESALPTSIDDELLALSIAEKDRIFLVASASCPWSHGAVIALVLAGFQDKVAVQWAGGARIEAMAFCRADQFPIAPRINTCISSTQQRFQTTPGDPRSRSYGMRSSARSFPILQQI